ncbi:hypothetical protein BK764_00190 [Bacillus thuringiensis serovar israelensis]|uniref:Uncharacterized protein n=4 Tax=Bacillus TaxID=1386 RepID=A0A242VYV6_BACTU|nr:hypothetical protein BTXL6_03910 [Bacillus thuringiensis]EEM20646.1 hypothetical protein bthur0001_41390 [Bacillus thuringiensis serovar tochigiensis BGSC 4Y1]EEM58679.1 hypothetical protein bthur0007_34820 [Bacillus thuringiensis serovar monterrey BGSC 4AJ1]OTW44012.1 hypothetical protein BK699_33490 [Bacillus thuringiensis serovar mexicanensis]OTW73614.1 hypothetical protein BK707_02015 [Bacillus thuringiensis serovar coreanensis]OTX01623.1 hypothetical protein BK705_18570 [Bacillus thuri
MERMRHTRNRQMTKIGAENFMRMKNIKISTIRKPDGKFPNRLDPTFKWKRDFDSVFTNLIFFRGESGQLKVVLAKESMQKLKKQGWIN